ncbi:MAG: efflux RND transporter permease subunit, partial [Victivallaceae bacterium]|nr:efflux RND transporter permease subunit [Victivallaceae bacterium]
ALFGVIAMLRLPMREYPQIDEPSVSVSTTYTGASAEVIESKITQIVENAVAGITGLQYIESTSRDGRSNVTLGFDITRNIDDAANDVRDRVSQILPKLPDGADAPDIGKDGANDEPVLSIGVYSSKMTRMELTDYASRYIIDRFSVIDGVGSVRIRGAQTQAMRIWLNSKRMAAKNITADDVISALKKENVEYPAGRLESKEVEFTVKVNRQYLTAEDFSDIVLRRDASGGMVKIADVAEVRIEPAKTRDHSEVNQEPMISFTVNKQSTANTLAVAERIRALMKQMESNLPDGMTLSVIQDDSKFIVSAIAEVKWSLLVSGILVFLIIFLFLGSLRASLIPAITIPLSLIAAFIVLYALGYSINLLTLLALVLAIGMVVDDAIVVLENIHRKIEDGVPPLSASVKGSTQVIFACIATTLVLAAVFLPLCLWERQTGKLFTEFAVTMTAAVCFSTFIALTLIPMLCSKILKPTAKRNFLIRMVDRALAGCENGYEKLLRCFVRVPLLTALVFAALCVLTAWGWRQLPGEYEPVEDRGTIRVSLKAPEGTGYYRMLERMREVQEIIGAEQKKYGIDYIVGMLPKSGNGSDGAVNTARLMLQLAPWSKRQYTSSEIITALRKKTKHIPGVSIQWQLPVGIASSKTPVEFVIGGPEYAELAQWRDIIMDKAERFPGILELDSDYEEKTPQIQLRVDRKRAGELGVSQESIGVALEALLGSKKVTTFLDRGQSYDVILQLPQSQRRNKESLSEIYVRSQRTGKMISLDNLLIVEEHGVAGELNRYNRVRAITLSGSLAPRYTVSQALNFLEKTVKEELPEYAQIFYKGQSKDYKDASGSIAFIFILAVLVAYFILAAQFESVLSPLVVMLTVPLGLAGAVFGLYWSGLSMNIYTQIGLIMLVGLAAKNGILIVEFANQLRDGGMEFKTASVQAAKLRLRPVLMTGISTVLGALPLIWSSGAGAASRHALGTVVVWGGLSSCLLTLFIVPVGYILLAKYQKPPKALEKKLIAEES